jgi:hypothetical protein
MHDTTGNQTILSYLSNGARGHPTATPHQGAWDLVDVVVDWDMIHHTHPFSNADMFTYCSDAVDEILDAIDILCEE